MFTTMIVLAMTMPAAAPMAQRRCPEEANVYHYRTRGRGWRGSFTLTDEGAEENTDRRAGGQRQWNREEPNRPCVIRLVDGDAVIEIDTRSGAIWYTDPNYRGYPRLTNLYVVTGVE
jgi:hypothetical protein